jgi:hypothetical protein
LAPGVSKPVFNPPDKTGKIQARAHAILGNSSTIVGMPQSRLNIFPLQLRTLQQDFKQPTRTTPILNDIKLFCDKMLYLIG